MGERWTLCLLCAHTYTSLEYSELEAPLRQYHHLSSDEPVTKQHLAVALTANLRPAAVRRACARLQLDDSAVAADAIATTTRQGNAGWHGKAVIEAARQRGGTKELLSLMQRFRIAFVEALQPQYLPQTWTVAHEATRAFGQHSVYNADEDIIVAEQQAVLAAAKL